MYCAVIVDQDWYLDQIINIEEGEEVMLLTPPGLADHYTWPKNLLTFVVPFTPIVTTVNLAETKNGFKLQKPKTVQNLILNRMKKLL
jgi:hypothetical protein